MTKKTEQAAAEAAAEKDKDLTPAEAKAEAKEQAASEEKVAEARAAEVPLEDDEKTVMHPTGPGLLQDGNVLDAPVPKRADPYAMQREKKPEGKKK